MLLNNGISNQRILDMQEIWKTVQDYGGNYEASNLGNVRSRDRIVKKFSALVGKEVDQFYKGKPLKPHGDKRNYQYVHIGVDGKKYNVQVGIMVLKAFQGKPNKDQVCCHNDGDPTNNKPSNLRWGTHKENMEDRKKHGNYKVGAEHHYSKAPQDIILKVKKGDMTIKEAMKETGMDYKVFWRAKRGDTWNHLN